MCMHDVQPSREECVTVVTSVHAYRLCGVVRLPLPQIQDLWGKVVEGAHFGVCHAVAVDILHDGGKIMDGTHGHALTKNTPWKSQSRRA